MLRLTPVPGQALERDIANSLKGYGELVEARICPGEEVALAGFWHEGDADKAAEQAKRLGLEVHGRQVKVERASKQEADIPKEMLLSDEDLKKHNHHIRQNDGTIQRGPLYKLDRLLREDGPRESTTSA